MVLPSITDFPESKELAAYLREITGTANFVRVPERSGYPVNASNVRSILAKVPYTIGDGEWRNALRLLLKEFFSKEELRTRYVRNYSRLHELRMQVMTGKFL